MISIRIGDAVVSVSHSGPDRDPWSGGFRQRYVYVIANGAAGWLYTGDDIRSGVGADPDENDAMGSLLSFLSACAESRAYGDGTGENASLFPDHVGQWAEENSDAIAVAAECPTCASYLSRTD